MLFLALKAPFLDRVRRLRQPPLSRFVSCSPDQGIQPLSSVLAITIL
jgi:hypothetical protein